MYVCGAVSWSSMLATRLAISVAHHFAAPASRARSLWLSSAAVTSRSKMGASLIHKRFLSFATTGSFGKCEKGVARSPALTDMLALYSVSLLFQGGRVH